jgi:hypothetical protein
MSCSASTAYGNDRECLSDAADPSDRPCEVECGPLHLVELAPNYAMVMSQSVRSGVPLAFAMRDNFELAVSWSFIIR